MVITVLAPPGTTRPEFLAVTWMAGSRTIVDNQRVPRAGTLPPTGKLADLGFTLRKDDSSERKLLVRGYFGDDMTAWAALRLLAPLPGQETVSLDMSTPLTDLDGDGVLDPFDDCVGPGGEPCPAPGPRDPQQRGQGGGADGGTPPSPAEPDGGEPNHTPFPDAGAPDLPQSGLLAAWRLDEGEGTTARDVSPNHNHGMLRNVSGSPWVTGRKGRALATSTGAWIYVPHAVSTDSISSGFSLAAWLYVDPDAKSESYQAVVARQRGADSANWFWLGLRDGRVRFAVHDVPIETAAAPQSRWVHVAATFDGATGQVFIDGQLAATRMFTAPPIMDTTGISVGADINGTDAGRGARHFGGSLDDVLLYNRPLTPAEVTALAGI